MRVLVIPGTTLVALEVLRSLRHVKGIQLIGAGSDTALGASWAYDEYFFLPEINDSTLQQLQDLVTYSKIEYIIFAHDEWLFRFSSKKRIGAAKLIVSSEESIRVSSFKKKTYEILGEFVKVPRIYSKDVSFGDLPLFVKPDRGQGARNTFQILSKNDLESFLRIYDESFLICEFLDGDEFTVDCFSLTNHEVIYVACRKRNDFSDGISKSTFYQDLSEFVDSWANIFSLRLQIVGAWFFQFKFDSESQPVLLELGMRVAGASGVSRLRGVNLSLLNLHLFSSETTRLSLYGQRNLASTFDGGYFDLGFNFSQIYVDLDDTLIVNENLNLNLIRYLQNQYINETKVAIITRNPNPEVLLSNYPELASFGNEIVRVPPNSSKAAYIDSFSTPFLFIDDSHAERIEVKSIFGDTVLVLDPSFCSQGDMVSER